MSSAAPSLPASRQPTTATATNADAALPKVNTDVGVEHLAPGLETAKKAMASHRLKDAVLALLRDNPADSSPEKMEKRREAMRQAQRMVAEGMQSGDPDAKEAADILRAYSSHGR